jgi:hypothetical protein
LNRVWNKLSPVLAPSMNAGQRVRVLPGLPPVIERPGLKKPKSVIEAKLNRVNHFASDLGVCLLAAPVRSWPT